MDTKNKPTIVLVHGAFADASTWNGVISLLQAKGHTVVAPPNPLRGLTHDSAYIAGVINQIDGPVLLVGHSYAGAILSNVGSMTKSVVGLVYVAAPVLNDGQSLQDVAGKSKVSILGPNLIPKTYPKGQGEEPGTEFFLKADKMREVFAADLSEEQVNLMAVTQRPIADRAFADVSGAPTWKNVRAWAIVATEDVAAGTDVIRASAEEHGLTITEVKASHAVMVSQPKIVADVILKAAESL
jgi:pimeloyl-ACP methyl ester carboxylesterase